jgi:hypothetical protein
MAPSDLRRADPAGLLWQGDHRSGAYAARGEASPIASEQRHAISSSKCVPVKASVEFGLLGLIGSLSRCTSTRTMSFGDTAAGWTMIPMLLNRWYGPQPPRTSPTTYASLYRGASYARAVGCPSIWARQFAYDAGPTGWLVAGETRLVFFATIEAQISRTRAWQLFAALEVARRLAAAAVRSRSGKPRTQVERWATARAYDACLGAGSAS